MINVIVILVSGLVAIFGYNYIPYKAYVIVAAFAGLFAALILTKIIKNHITNKLKLENHLTL